MDLAVNGLRLMGHRYGVGRYVEYLLRHWADMPNPFGRIVIYTPGPLDDEIHMPGNAEHRIVSTVGPNAYWEQVVLARLRRQHELLFCPSYVVPLLGRGKTVLTHLGSYEALPSAFPTLERWKSRLIYQLSAHRADRVITVNQQPIPIQQLETRLRNIFEQRREKTMFIAGAGNLTYGEIIEVIDAAKGAGVTKVGIVTEAMRRRGGADAL